jgi:hypothetical protein
MKTQVQQWKAATFANKGNENLITFDRRWGLIRVKIKDQK